MLRSLMFGSMVCLSGAPALAAALDVVNSGFESPGGDLSSSATGYYGGNGTFNPYTFGNINGGAFYTTATVATEPAAPAALPGTDGTHLGYINDSPTTYFFQTLAGPDGVQGNADDPTYQPNTLYTLTVANGRRSNGQDFEGSDIGFGTNTVASGIFAVLSRDVIHSTSEQTTLATTDVRTPLAGTFTDHTFQINTANFPGAVGLPITIFFGTTTGSGATDFDRVRVDATTVPEPAMFGLAAFVGAATLMRRQRI